MLVVQMLLPRFLVFEVLLFHLIQQSQGCKRQLNILKGNKNADSTPTTRCSIDFPTSVLKWMPLIFDDQGKFLLPAKGGDDVQSIPLTSGNHGIRIACPGAKIKASSSGPNAQSLRCTGDRGSVLLSDQKVAISDLSCSRSIRESIQKTEQSCGPAQGSKFVHVGWNLNLGSGRTRFVPQITVCHDKDGEATFYTNHTLYGESIAARDTGGRSPSFKEGRGFFTQSSASTMYKIKTQSRTFSNILTAEEKAEVFRPDEQRFLARGHLSPDADFVYQEWQDATYYFFNAAPQWQVFNGGNWVAVEQEVRSLASRLPRHQDLRIFTGTHGNYKVGNKAIYLSRKNGRNLIPVPLYFWKLVQLQQKAIVFVGINDPNLTNPNQIDHLCPRDSPQLCEQNGWTMEDRLDASRGYLYCCMVGSLTEKIPWIEQLFYGQSFDVLQKIV